MTDMISTDRDPLLRPLHDAQQAVLQIIGDAALEIGTWPVYQYVQAKADDLRLSLEEVLASLPTIPGALVYSLVGRDQGGRDEEPVRLSIAGMAHLGAYASTVDMFLRVVDDLATRRAASPFDPQRVVTVEVTGPQLVSEMGLGDEPLVRLLPEILKREPATWHGLSVSNEVDWIHQPSSFIRRFHGVRDVNDYMTRLRAWIMPARPAAPAQPVSPLGLVAAFDYLDVAWRLKFGTRLIRVPSVERAARLTFDVTTAEEFDSRLSALGEMFKGMTIDGNGRGHFDRLGDWLTAKLPLESQEAVIGAVDILRKVTHIRNAGQHADASRQAAIALPALGLSYPIADYQAAWQTVQTRTIAALDTIRVEIQAA